MIQAQVRAGTAEDLPAVARLWQALDEFHRQRGLAFPHTQQAAEAWIASFERTLGRFSFLWVAEADDGQPAAFLLARLKRAPAYLGGVLLGEISDLYVDDTLRGQGIGGQLAALAIDKLREAGAHSIEVQVMQQNPEGLAFWLAQGFQPELSQVRLMLQPEAGSDA